MRISVDRAPALSSFRTLSRLVAGAACMGVLAGPSAFAAPAQPEGAAAPADATLASTASATAQDGDDAVLEFFRKVEFTGLIDTYFTYNFNKPPTASITPLRNFDVRHNQFSLGLVELAMTRPVSKDDLVGFRFDLQYGQVAQIFNGDPVDNNALVNVQQGYVSYFAPVGTGLTLDVGKFVTPIGTEPTESNLNNNYSRAFLYALGPYYHVGARLAYNVNDKVALGGMIVNGWNATGDNNSGKSVGGSLTIKPTSKVTVIQNVLVGPEQTDNADDVRTYSDTNLAVVVNDTVSTGLNYVYAMDSVGGEDVNWQGLALYFRHQATPTFAWAPRFEWFDDTDGFVTGASQALKEFTLTAEVKHPKGLIFRAEYRRDWSDEDYFLKGESPVDNQNTFTIAFIYAFSSKAP
ncbi:MAG: porin [Vicinamibacterales bacterium]